MDSKEKETSCQNNCSVDYSFPISEYAKQLDLTVRDRYLQKISIGIDPVLVEGKDFKPDCLPPVESTDILCYLVLETSFYTRQQFKAFRSLEAYNQMVFGFIASVQGHIITNKCVVLVKVRHSQRMNDSLISCWVIRHGKRRNDFVCSLPRLQGWSCRILFAYSKCTVLFRSVDKNKWQTFLHASEVLLASTHVCQTSGIWKSSKHKLYIGKKNEKWFRCQDWEPSQCF